MYTLKFFLSIYKVFYSSRNSLNYILKFYLPFSSITQVYQLYLFWLCFGFLVYQPVLSNSFNSFHSLFNSILVYNPSLTFYSLFSRVYSFPLDVFCKDFISLKISSSLLLSWALEVGVCMYAYIQCLPHSLISLLWAPTLKIYEECLTNPGAIIIECKKMLRKETYSCTIRWWWPPSNAGGHPEE